MESADRIYLQGKTHLFYESFRARVDTAPFSLSERAKALSVINFIGDHDLKQFPEYSNIGNAIEVAKAVYTFATGVEGRNKSIAQEVIRLGIQAYRLKRMNAGYPHMRVEARREIIKGQFGDVTQGAQADLLKGIEVDKKKAEALRRGRNDHQAAEDRFMVNVIRDLYTGEWIESPEQTTYEVLEGRYKNATQDIESLIFSLRVPCNMDTNMLFAALYYMQDEHSFTQTDHAVQFYEIWDDVSRGQYGTTDRIIGSYIDKLKGNGVQI